MAAKSSEAADEARTRIPFWGVLVAAGLVVLAAGLKTGSSIIAPVFLGITLVITFQPMRRRLERHLPSWFATGVVLIAIYGALVVIIGSIALAIGRLAVALPTYASSFTSLYNSTLSLLSSFGIGKTQLASMLSSLNISSFTGIAQTLLSGVSSGLSLVVLLLTVIIFLAADGAGFNLRMDRIRAARPAVADAFTDFAKRVRSYWVVTTVFGLIVAVIDVIALFVIGTPLAVIWGVLAFVTNYVPNIGFVFGLVPPALIALLDGGVVSMVEVVVAYVVINFLIQTVIQPRFTGDAAGVTPTVAFLSLIVWGYLLGALGALIAVPATMFVKAVLVDHGSTANWFGALLDSEENKRKKAKQDKKAGRSGDPSKVAGSPSAAAKGR